MTLFFEFIVLGIVTGAGYALAGQAVVVFYRGSGILNFASVAIGMAAAYVMYEITSRSGWNIYAAFVLGLVFAAAFSAVAEIVIIRGLRHASPIARMVATLGILIAIQAAAVIRYGESPVFLPSMAPKGSYDVVGLSLTYSRILILLSAVVLTAALWALYRYSMFGIATTATAENVEAAAALGRSAQRVALIHWMIGGMLAAGATILVAPTITLQPSALVLLLVEALAVSLIGGFTSFPLTLLAGVLLGVSESLVSQYVEVPGLSSAVPFIAIVAVLVVRGRAIPLRGDVLERLQAVGTGRVRPGVVLTALVVCALLTLSVSDTWAASFSITFGYATVGLSLVVLTGYAGQISLGQFALAGIGAWVSAASIHFLHLPFLVAVLAALVVAVPVGLVFALPAVKTRGINLAVVTLGLGAAVDYMIFGNTTLTGSQGGLSVGIQSVFGVKLDNTNNPQLYSTIALVIFVIAAVLVANVRRSVAGRRLLALRTNERAAVSMGISVIGGKLYAFGLASALASLGGVLLAFRARNVDFTNFASFLSILVLAYAVIGGLGYIWGAVFGASLAGGAILTRLGAEIFGGIEQWIPVIGGLALILMLLQDPDGVARGQIALVNRLERLIPRKRQAAAPAWRGLVGRPTRKVASRFAVKNLSVRFGGVTALNSVSLEVATGEIVGLIGPNGAGKTTFIDAVTGFVNSSSSSLTLGDIDLSEMSATRRARAGLTRSFQSLELFDDMTVLENLLTSADTHATGAYFASLIRPGKPLLPPAAVAAVEEFGLEPDLFRRVSDLPQGKRRLVAIARAVAAWPTVLLLDEPAAGLSASESSELAHLIRRLASGWGIGVLLIEHDMTFVMETCDRITVLDFGQVIADGTPEDVQSDAAVIEAYLGVPQAREAESDEPTEADKQAPGPTSMHPTDSQDSSETLTSNFVRSRGL